MTEQVRRWLWLAGWPARAVLLTLVRAYRLTVGQVVGGGCRFHPSCSAYAMDAIRNCGAAKGIALSAWRVLRCSPLSPGGVDYPPSARIGLYDTDIHWTSRRAAPVHDESGLGASA